MRRHLLQPVEVGNRLIVVTEVHERPGAPAQSFGVVGSAGQNLIEVADSIQAVRHDQVRPPPHEIGFAVVGVQLDCAREPRERQLRGTNEAREPPGEKRIPIAGALGENGIQVLPCKSAEATNGVEVAATSYRVDTRLPIKCPAADPAAQLLYLALDFLR